MSRKQPHLPRIEALGAPILLGRNGLTMKWFSESLGLSGPGLENVLADRKGLSEEDTERFRSLVLHSITHDPKRSSSESDPPSWEPRPAIERMPYLPIAHLVGLEPERSAYPALPRPPRAHVVIDRLVLRARFKSEHHHREFASRVRDPRSTHGNRFVPVSIPSMDDRDDLVATAGPADMEFVDPRRRHLRYHRIVDIKSSTALLAKIAWRPFRSRCRDHRMLPLRPFDCTCRPSTRAPTKGLRCVGCYRANWCDRCERLSQAQLDIKIDVTGAACHQQLETGVLRSLFLPFVDPVSIEIIEIHVAVDIERPMSSLLLLPPMSTRTKRTSVRTSILAGHYWSVSQEVRRKGFSVVLYDKFTQERDRAESFPRRDRPRHMDGWEYATRCEFRLRPKDRRAIAGGDAPWAKELMEHIAAWSIADLTSIEQLDIEAAMLGLARTFDFSIVAAEKAAAVWSKGVLPGTVRLRHPSRDRDRELERAARRAPDKRHPFDRSFVELVRTSRNRYRPTRGIRSTGLYAELVDEIRASAEQVVDRQAWRLEDIVREHVDELVSNLNAALGVS